MNALRYIDRVLTEITRVRTTGTFFSWLDVPTHTSGGDVVNPSTPCATDERCVSDASVPSPPLHVVTDRDACD